MKQVFIVSSLTLIILSSITFADNSKKLTSPFNTKKTEKIRIKTVAGDVSKLYEYTVEALKIYENNKLVTTIIYEPDNFSFTQKKVAALHRHNTDIKSCPREYISITNEKSETFFVCRGTSQSVPYQEIISGI